MPSRRSAAIATAAYVALTLAATWPLARGIARDVPGDFGDPLLNMWILAWSARHPGRFDAPIFFPHPLALAYSDHLTPQALGIAPVLAATANPIFAYNLLYLSTFVISAIGMWLLVRELASDDLAAFVAGLAFAFAPYRFSATPHVQVLSSMWMPFAVLGFRRFFRTGRAAPLAAGALAWTLQNLSCGYYLFFFSASMAIYVVWEALARRIWRIRGQMIALAAAVAGVAAMTLPFLIPYARLRHLGFEPRPIDEVQKYAADVYAWFTADPNLRLWGGVAAAWPHAEGALFPGVAISALALIGIITSSREVMRSEPSRPHHLVAATLAVGAWGLVLLLLFGFSIRIPQNHPVVKIADFDRTSAIAALLTAIWLSRSRPARRRAAAWLRSPAAPFAGIAIFAVAMSFGPAVHARGRLVTPHGLYRVFYDWVPGFDGLRVPARFAMIAAFALAALGGFGIAAIRGWSERRESSGRAPSERPSTRDIAVALAAAIVIAAESFTAPLPLNQNDTTYRRSGLAPLPPRVWTDDGTPPIYRFVATLGRDTAILELPLGEPAFDVRYMFYAVAHRHPLVNGYSGGAPAAYGLLAEALADILTRPEAAWSAVRATGATHVVVHEAAYAAGRGSDISRILRSFGARDVALFGTDRIFRIQ